jgi:hypothetical protein
MPIPTLLFLLAGCGTAPLAIPQAPFDARISGDGLTLDDAKLDDRYILRRASGEDCSDLAFDGWTVTSLFQADDDGYLPPFLARTCAIDRDPTWPGTYASPDEFDALGDVAPDLVGVAGLGNVATPTQVAASFLEQVRPFPDYTSVPAKPAWLTLVDSSPTAANGSPDAYDVAGNYEHGQQLATLALRATCDGITSTGSTPDCVARIGTELALGFTETTTGPERDPDGGEFGSQADLARAIEAAVETWQHDATAGPLVLNLSLGWHPEAGGADLATATPAVLAVYDALLYASCKDALALAAVGQVDSPTGAADSTGALYPAAWESEDPPTAAVCKAALGNWWTAVDDARDATVSPYSALVYAVSAVDVDRDTLANQRPDATAVHAAPGSHLGFYNPGLAAAITPISGTSAATVVVSSAAAVVRSHFPGLDAHEVMAVLRAAADTSGVPADVCHDPASGCAATHYVTVCESLAQACDVAGTCPPTYTAATCAGIASAAPIVPSGNHYSAVLIDGQSTGVCGGGTATWETNPAIAADEPCPAADDYAATALPITLPQPPGNECPWCPALLPNRVDMRTTDDLGGLRNLTIAVEKFGQWTYYPLGQRTGTEISVYLPTVFDANVMQITLSYNLPDQQFMYVEPIYRTW